MILLKHFIKRQDRINLRATKKRGGGISFIKASQKHEKTLLETLLPSTDRAPKKIIWFFTIKHYNE